MRACSCLHCQLNSHWCMMIGALLRCAGGDTSLDGGRGCHRGDAVRYGRPHVQRRREGPQDAQDICSGRRCCVRETNSKEVLLALRSVRSLLCCRACATRTRVPDSDTHNGKTPKKWSYFLDLCVSSLRRGHANLLCIVPILTDDSRRRSKGDNSTRCSYSGPTGSADRVAGRGIARLGCPSRC